ncbi:MAG: extracellular solute-binding protein [Hyphomicrobiales bacterium]
MPFRRALAALIALFCLLAPAAAAPRHGIAMHGEPALTETYTNLPYANPDAPKGGQYREAVTGTFDSLNPFIVRGQVAAGSRTYLFESLMARNKAEAFSLYGLIAETIDVSDDRTTVTFRLRPEAKFSDGKPVTAEDVKFSLETLRDHGRPNFKSYYSRVKAVETPDPRTVVFRLPEGDRELVMLLGLMPVLPKHYFEGRNFEATSLDPPIGSGPYVVGEVKPGESIVYRRDPNYWGKDLPVNRGLWNFDTVRFDYFRDTTTGFEALKKGLVDVRSEPDPVRWATGYDFPGVKDGTLKKDELVLGVPRPASGIVMNTRRAPLSDIRVRQALIKAFDFEWANTNLFYGLMVRTEGYFDGSALSSIRKPADDREKALLAQVGGTLPVDVLEGTWTAPKSDGTGRDRKNLRDAIGLLKEAGYSIRNGVMTNEKTGAPLTLELLTQSREQERIGLHFGRTLKAIGIALDLRTVDSAQFQERLSAYDFDLVPMTWFNSLSPGNEQAFYWGSAGRDKQGTRNYMGAADPAIDKTITELTRAEGQEEFEAAVRLLDRLLIAGAYVVPLYNPPGLWVARWANRVERPDKPSLYGYDPDAMWAAKP